MPMYEYRCHSCGKVFELIQKFSDEPLQSHPDCGGAVERLVSAPALQFKGSGWYITDYAKSNGKTKEGSEKTETSEKSGKKDSDGESTAKPDASSSSTGAGTSANPAAPAGKK